LQKRGNLVLFGGIGTYYTTYDFIAD